MANRYWVGGTGNWDNTTTHWSATSGGANGASVPTSSDNVFIDSNSGLSGGTINIDGLRGCLNLTSTTGIIYTITNNAINIYGSIVLESSIILDNVNFTFKATGASNIKSNGCVITTNTSFTGTGTWTLQDNLNILKEFYQENGTFNASGFDVTANDFYFYADTGFTPTINMGSGNWITTGLDTITFTCGWYIDDNSGQIVTINPSTSTIKLQGSINYFYGGGKTYNNLRVSSNTRTDADGIRGNNTFNDLTIDPGYTVYFQETSTQTISSFTALGSLGNVITLKSLLTGTPFILSKSSGVVSCDYLSLQDSNTTGGAAFYAGENSINVSGNNGWIFGTKYTNISKPSSTSYTNINTTGKQQYDQSDITYDNSSTYYDGINYGQYTNINKPTSTTYTKISK